MRTTWILLACLGINMMQTHAFIRSYTLLSAKIKGQINFGTVQHLLDNARRYRNREYKMFEMRAAMGIDKRTEEFKVVSPVIFEDSPERVEEIQRHSQMINVIEHTMRKDKIKAKVEDVLRVSNTPSNSGSVHCPFKPPTKCKKSKYRSLDGSCNNLKYPLRGAAFTPFTRDLPPAYQNIGGIDLPRTKGVNGQLPSARLVSRKVHQVQHEESKSTETSDFFTFWGQFVAHMVTDRALASGFNKTKIDCCAQTHPTPAAECFNINLPADDPFRLQGRTCLGFLRSLETTDLECKGGRQQLNAASSYIDGSAVYGVEHEKADFLRTREQGLLATSEPNELPFKAHVNKIAAKSGFSFVRAGDPRAPEVAPLTGLHTIWVREHNRVAAELAAVNPTWDDETLYQEARRIIVAIIQHINYNEWLPSLLDPALMTHHGLASKKNSYFTGYSKSVDASTTNAISTAAFRFGHSLLPSLFSLCKKDFSETTSPALPLADMFFRPNVYLLNEHTMIRGLLVKPSQPMDSFLNPTLTSKLFEIHPGQGVDLAAINIQRGRDHGLPSYNAWRRAFKLSVASSFTSGPGGFEDISDSVVQALASVYSHPDDVDLWTGGVSEKSSPGAVLGPLFGHMMARQFRRYKRGDRYWYETLKKPQAFTVTQLKEIHGMTISRIICNTYDVDTIQKHAFKVQSVTGNSRVSCDTLPQINFAHWKI